MFESAQAALDAVPALLGRGDGIGSNSWVVAGSKTTTGKPLLANDPHLGTAIPGIWYQIGLHCRTVSAACPFDVSGFTFSGLPGVVIGHNQSIAWGLTNLAPDVTDFYLEKVTDHTYLRDGQQVPLETTTETIKVAGGERRAAADPPDRPRPDRLRRHRLRRPGRPQRAGRGWCRNRTRMRSRSPGPG